MENKRPRLDDPKEFAIIRELYLGDHNPKDNDIDPIERLDRMESKQRQQQNDSR